MLKLKQFRPEISGGRVYSMNLAICGSILLASSSGAKLFLCNVDKLNIFKLFI